MITIVASDVAGMRSIGAAIAGALSKFNTPMVIALEGELGAGKTTLVGGVLNALGFRGHVRSPTYTLIEPYEFGDRSVYHLDLYRLTDPREVDPLGLRDLLQPGSVFLIEWPERGEGFLPPADVTICLRYVGVLGRDLSLGAHSKPGQSVVDAVSAAAKS